MTYSIVTYPGTALPSNYLNLIRSKWMNSLRYSNDYFKLIDSQAFYSSYQQYIDNLLNRKETLVRLAVLTSDQDVCLGFSITRDLTLDYVFVDKDQRKQGIATSLVPNIDTITHLTRTGLAVWASKYPSVKFNPFF